MRESWDFLRNARMVRTASEYSSLPGDYIRSRQGTEAGMASFEGIHTVVMFIGIGRSGTTLVGALLDAHPRVVIAKQQNVLKYLYPFAFSRQQIFRLLQKNSAEQAKNSWPGGGNYNYSVAGQFQGRFGEIEVIGDKSKSAQTVEWLSSRPELVERLARITQCRVRMLHVIRNPFDTIARRSQRRHLSLEKISREYFSLTERLQDLLRRLEAGQYPDTMCMPVHLEHLINNPSNELATICSSLGVEPGRPYLEACSEIVYTKPSRARELVSWPPQLIEEIQLKIESIPWLNHYSYKGS